MHVLSLIFAFFSVTRSTLARPYEYSYYISSPGHYQTLSVRDGEVRVNEGPPFPASPGAGPLTPGYRQERIGPGFNQAPALGGNYPLSLGGPDFVQGRMDPGFQKFPIGEIDPLFVPSRRIPEVEDRHSISSSPDIRYIPTVPQSDFPEFGTRLQPRLASYTGLSRRDAKAQEIDESDESVTGKTTESTDREEVTTQAPCSFCGVDKINPMDKIDDTIEPDVETVELKNTETNVIPNFLVQNSVVNPASVVVSGLPLNTPVIPYYVLVQS